MTVRDIAETAQADLGHGYIWLDDVTYLDWQRYHDLTRSKFCILIPRAPLTLVP
jgi:hypothetical protein